MLFLTSLSRLVLLSLPCAPSLPEISPRPVPPSNFVVSGTAEPHAPWPQHKPDAPQLDEALPPSVLGTSAITFKIVTVLLLFDKKF